MDSTLLVKRLLEQRESWVDLEPGKRLKIRRPAEAEIPAFMRATPIEQAAQVAVDWEGVTEADLLSAAVGASDPVPFSADLWPTVVADRVTWLRAAVVGAFDAINAHGARVEDTAKN
jgi:hypothetical protein